ncbi:MAG: hypothetical protein HYW89_01120 [Candidatus Sungiibacteriota bacterium]|uniref:Uncharacterized protein n=1 Tax=Candidatus Sungiibacteriota bacterium TaxID=2750080 RepID=A0A7T5RK18_9BACT|nr:MAG: hypothetical protein HYW89_01120 [Candidatus Sungbacteria bacterium]
MLFRVYNLYKSMSSLAWGFIKNSATPSLACPSESVSWQRRLDGKSFEKLKMETEHHRVLRWNCSV